VVTRFIASFFRARPDESRLLQIDRNLTIKFKCTLALQGTDNRQGDIVPGAAEKKQAGDFLEVGKTFGCLRMVKD
jgi:hypothetical protein